VQSRNDPAVCISWDDAAAYCNWRSRKSGLTPCYSINKDKSVDTDREATGYRLPTEAEWEFAARSGGKDNTYACRESSGDLWANYKATSENDKWIWTNPVKDFPPNELGLYGLSGNVWEWCEDWYFNKAYASLQNRKVHNPCITLDNAPGLNKRVMRGGSFYNSKGWLRCTSRGNGLPYAYSNRVGFRCARNAQ
jgi:formylglycine-generating enzyme required for sulfatase activity